MNVWGGVSALTTLATAEPETPLARARRLRQWAQNPSYSTPGRLESYEEACREYEAQIARMRQALRANTDE